MNILKKDGIKVKIIKNIQCVIFDMDGVIFDTENLCMQLWIELADRQGFKKDVRKPMYESIGTNIQVTTEIFKSYYGEDFPFEKYKEEVRAATKAYINERGMPIKQGAVELLEYLKETGFRIGLASSTNHQTVKTNLLRARLYEYFDVIIGGDMVERSKPEPDIFLECCKTLGIKPNETFIIEDSYNGIRAAKSAGAIPLMVPDMIPADEEMKQLSFKIFETLDDVRFYISELSILFKFI